MEAYAMALRYAIPFFFVLIVIEFLLAKWMKKDVYSGMDTISSLSSGMTNVLKSLLGLSIVIVSYEWMESKIGIFDIQSSVALYLIAFVGIDFASYWAHRFNHTINVMWNRHIIHHSSEEFNLPCALRQEISEVLGVYFFLSIPLALLGIPPEVIGVVAPIHLFAQFWYHTTLIGRMGFLEYILMTPSHHRVHHAVNPEYLDKNYSAIFVLWDRWFGTFQEEKEEIPPVYGTVKPVNTWNPVVINFMHMWQLIKDAWRTQKLKDKILIWFKPTGWRPEDVSEKYPLEIPGVYTRKKYNPTLSMGLIAWSWFQFIFCSILLYLFVYQFSNFQYYEVIAYSLFIFFTIFAYTTLMDQHKLAIPIEIFKLILGVGIIYQLGSWFHLETFGEGMTYFMLIYMVIALLMTLYFSRTKEKKSSTNLLTNI